MLRFLHTSDWQLGITRHFLSEEAQAAYTLARLDMIRRLGRVAEEEGCELVVVAGDVFESNQVDRRTVARAAEALAAIPVPVFLLPGNHDSLDAASVYRSPAFTAPRCPPRVRVFLDSAPVVLRPGVELVGVPWTSRRPLRDLVAAACSRLEPFHGGLRVVVAHGCVDTLSPDRDDPAAISQRGVEALLAEERIHYLALGDRHSLTPVGASGRVWYSGTPEPTDHDEEAPGQALIVELDQSRAKVTPRPIGTWRFLRHRFELASDADLAAAEHWLRSAPDKERTVLKLHLRGTLTLRQAARLESILENARDLFAAVEDPERHKDLVVIPEDEDFRGIELSGFAAAALAELRQSAAAGGKDAETARAALALLLRLVRGAE